MIVRTAAPERLLALALAAAALLVHAPLFVRSPLGPDPVMYDLQAQLVHEGGVLYRDILEPNLPGAVWMHLAVRSTGGWSSEALRVFDLAWVSLAAWLATRFICGGIALRMCAGIAIIAGYTTLSEWCHCQRDVWMLPFVLGAVLLRCRRLERPDTSRDRLSSIAEGALWGAAVWLKPHVVIPAACVVVASWINRPARMNLRTRLVTELFVIAGGALIGAAGVIWLARHDAWQPLWTMLTEWNRDYVAASGDRWSWERLWSVQQRLAPWSLVHLLAIPIAIATLVSSVRQSPANPASPDPRHVLAAALYLGWIAQTLLLQHLFDYVHAPALLLGVVVVAGAIPATAAIGPGPRSLTLAGIVCLLPSLLVRGPQLAVWPRCLTGPASPELTSTLARLPLPEWIHLAQVTRFLKDQGVKDGELTAYHTHTIHLYPALGIRPSTRFVFTETHLRLFPSRAGEIGAALARSRQKYVVSDLLEAGLDPAAALDDSEPANWQKACPPDALKAFPFDQPVVFRSGPYLVHEVIRPVGPVETRFFPLAAESAGL